jgi:hypothetical protein
LYRFPVIAGSALVNRLHEPDLPAAFRHKRVRIDLVGHLVESCHLLLHRYDIRIVTQDFESFSIWVNVPWMLGLALHGNLGGFADFHRLKMLITFVLPG